MASGAVTNRHNKTMETIVPLHRLSKVSMFMAGVTPHGIWLAKIAAKTVVTCLFIYPKADGKATGDVKILALADKPS